MDTKRDDKKTNHLKNETSPYLLQHARNPVEWYPWGEEALEKAKVDDKPILLSIGYSACHWCHVMARESFEDQATAELMNEIFVNIKVDREERPDLDKIYQASHQLLTQRAGGWPLTMFLTPDSQIPFFGGTYFPNKTRQGLPSFTDVLQSVNEIFRERREDIEKQNVSLIEFLRSTNPAVTEAGIVLDAKPLYDAHKHLENIFNRQYGGFGNAPKFPMPTSIERLLRDWAASFSSKKVDRAALEMPRHTLEKMALGGIYDQLGGGFCRYSVDERWMIPHFEKMLYDNGLLLALYADAWQVTGDELFRHVVEETAAWVTREMQSPRGGYYSSLDADSEGQEGKFYVWDRKEVEKVLDKGEYQVFTRRFGLDEPANFKGKWHLHVNSGLKEVAEKYSMSEKQVSDAINSAKQKLFDVREKRVRPHRDDKILASWNGLTLKGMARAGRLLGRDDFIESSERSLDFIRNKMFKKGRLLATCRDERARLPGHLDDYAFLLDGVFELLQARWRTEDMNFAVELADVLLKHFEDGEGGGFYFTAHDHEQLIYRPKPLTDEAMPSGNGVAAHALGRLGHLLGETRYLDAAERTLKVAWASIQNAPSAYTALLLALEEHLSPPQTIVLRGAPDEMKKWHERCSRRYAPGRITLAVPDGEGELPDWLGERRPVDGVAAYVCTGTVCSAPITSLSDLETELEKTETPEIKL